MGLIPPGFGERFKNNAEQRDGLFSEENAYQLGRKIIDNDSIKPESLVGSGKPYNAADVGRDVQETKVIVQERERESTPHEKEAYKLAKVLEVIVYQNIKNGWFGKNVTAILPSQYDDVINGIDVVTQFEISNSSATATAHVGLGIDVTYNQDIKRKIPSLLEEIDSGTLGTVKYFQAPDGSFVGSLNKVPRFIISIDENNVKDLARAWYNQNPALKNDPIREQLLIQLIDQSDTFEKYAKSKQNQDAAARYRVVGRLCRNILGVNQITPELRNKFGSDRTFQKLEKLLLDIQSMSNKE